jgi:hypothetical protein
MRRVLGHQWAVVRRQADGREVVASLDRIAEVAHDRAIALRAKEGKGSQVTYRVAPVEIVEEG